MYYREKKSMRDVLSREKETVRQRDRGSVHTLPDTFENATLLLQIRLPSTLICIKRSTKTELFENALQSGTI